MPYMYGERHGIILAVPDEATKEALLSIQENFQSETVLATTEDTLAGIPSVSSITVIDPTLLQLFNASPFLEDLRPEDRIPFAQSIAPGSFSKSGVFVDSYFNYVKFLGLIGSFNPDSYIYKQSFRKRHPKR
jgi:hypothetical protein